VPGTDGEASPGDRLTLGVQRPGDAEIGNQRVTFVDDAATLVALDDALTSLAERSKRQSRWEHWVQGFLVEYEP
jgi:hypothetical protein